MINDNYSSREAYEAGCKLLEDFPEEFLDLSGCGEYTLLAENIADQIGCDEVLADSDHEIWQVAIDCFDDILPERNE
jgi:hypothetical protein